MKFKTGDMITPVDNTYSKFGMFKDKTYKVNKISYNAINKMEIVSINIEKNTWVGGLNARCFKLTKPRKPVTLGMLARK